MLYINQSIHIEFVFTDGQTTTGAGLQSYSYEQDLVSLYIYNLSEGNRCYSGNFNIKLLVQVKNLSFVAAISS